MATIESVTPLAGPAAGGNRVVVVGCGLTTGRSWGLRFGGLVVPAHVHPPDGQGEDGQSWRLSAILPPHPVTIPRQCSRP